MSTAGPKSASANAGAWNNPTNAYSSNDQWASSVAGPSDWSNQLYLMGFGFAVSTGATINGVTVAIERHGQVANYLRDYNIQLLNTTGNPTGTNKANTGVYWPTSDATATYGSASDLWGCALTDTWVNNANFGVFIQGFNTHPSNTYSLYIDYVSITVDYDLAGQPMQARSRLVPFVRKSQIGW